MQQLWNATYQIYQQHMVLIQLLTETRCPDPDLDFFIERKSDFVSLGPSQKAYSGLLQILKSIYWLFQKPINSAYLLEHRIIEYQLQDWEDEHPHDGFNQTLFKAVSLHLHTQLFLRDLEQFKLGQGDTMTMCKYFDLAEALLESLEQCNHVVLDYLVCMLCFALLSVQKKHFDPQTKKGAKRQIHQITRHFENNPFFIKIIEEKASEVGFTLR
ncbi:hypothetical protein EDD86DRAFT_101399 [Gorgonomyces haynaldii]|nr:hypothetical protein EDD86DRAFT_101399 [Gorgonomyces haynaldii]